MQATGEWVLVFVLAVSALGLSPGKAVAADTITSSTPAEAALQTSALQLTGPTACPPAGCAGGQRIGMRYEFDFGSTTYDPGPEPNVMVCIYASSNWLTTSPNVAAAGEISQQPYIPPTGTGCATPPAGYSLVAERVTTLEVNTPGDGLRFAFRLGAAGTGSGQVRARLFTRTGTNWNPVTTASANSQILAMVNPPTANPVYVANDSTSCGTYSPCYINSDGDGANGVGTGLKDAVDAITTGTSIFIVGNYSIKTSTVLVNQKITISGVGDARISYTGLNNTASCGVGMLALDETVVIRGLNIDDGNCTNPNRNLIEVNSRTGRTGSDDIVLIESNDLNNGDNAIFVRADNTDKLVVRYNTISGNGGHGLYYETAGTSVLEVIANNIVDNQASLPISCGADGSAPISSRVANHNYWGASAPSPGDTHCMITDAKRLGALIAPKTSAAGVHASLVQVTGTKTYASGFSNQVAVSRSGAGNTDFNIYIIDHGYLASSGPPFSGPLNGESPSPCSNYWDVFLASGDPVESNLNLFFKYYDKEGETPGCLAVINSTQYCDQTTDSGKYPLFWLDPSSSSITSWWDPVGAAPDNLDTEDGQTTTCNIANNEIQVSIDGSGRPNLNDLGYTPFMVGIPVIKSFRLLASNQNVNVEWITNNEPDINGFYILHGTDAGHLTPINGDLIAHLGNSSTGRTYNLTDSGRVNGTTYYYRLQVVRSDGFSFYSEIKHITVNAATPTSPPPTRTWTPVLPTRTPTLTKVPTSRPTSNATRTFTPSKSKTPTSTRMVLPTLTSTANLLTPGALETQMAFTPFGPGASGQDGNPPPEEGTPGGDLTLTPGQADGTELAMVDTQTPELSATETALEVVAGTATSSGANPWVSLLLGILAGLVMVGGAGGYWYYSARK